jgi:dihydrofolate reductase
VEQISVAPRRELVVNMFVSLDGFTAGGQDWGIRAQPGPELQAYALQVLHEPQVIVLGRVTYQDMAGYWPGSDERQAPAMNRLPKLVFSNTLREPLAWSNSRLVTGDPVARIQELKAQAGDPLYCAGSISLATTLLNHDLVDRLRLVVFPVVLGATGTKPLFPRDSQPIRMDQVAATVLDSTVTVLDYRRATGKRLPR